MNTKTLTVSLTPAQYQFIQEQVQNGRYPSADEAIALALELLEESIYLEDSENKRRYQEWLEETRKKVVVGIEPQKRRREIFLVEASFFLASIVFVRGSVVC